MRISSLLSPLTIGALTLSLPLQADPLQDQLDQRKKEFEVQATPEKIASYNKGVEAVRKSGMVKRALKVGDTAPDFTLNNALGKKVTLSKLLNDGPVVITWYRGSWCPYCNLTLQAYQENLPKLKKAGAQFIALTPELPDHSLSTKKKHHLEFEVLTDLNNQVAKQFKIVFEMTPEVSQAMEKLAGLHNYNGKTYNADTLPLSATYIITPDRKIAYAFLDAEYRNRATPEMILSELKKINKQQP
ncbi:AhpC/TSA family protein [Verrucomicrobiaceae bacterium N1E253]|uniref:thioredoxin-dependent peroxiredoxin n=1 Tax=Oceaniferula marina TaxID=2748318 RepID=A0A851GGF1_9BACT|nr:peroxiredoxin-like family protein [Oceaniferula marina]NWK55982.1 AhpC/TSA family protein [Oceaniferula marina]